MDQGANPPYDWPRRRGGTQESRRRWLPSRRLVRAGAMLLIVLMAGYVVAMAVRVAVRRYYIFLPDYFRWALAHDGASSRPTHLFVLLADHFEPSDDAAAVDEWITRFRQVADRHRDADGRPPRHTWFYPGEQSNPAILARLRALTVDGLGEVELHHHHQYKTADSLQEALRESIEEFQRFGFLKTRTGATRFAFVHGNSGLDNSNGDEFCGVDTEIGLLKSLGCFADFTFPSLFETSQPFHVNSIYAVRDDPGPKSYRTRLPLQSLRSGTADLMLFEGPLLVAPSWNLRHLFLDVEDGDLHAAIPASPARVDRWVRADVHVDGRPDWVFIKLFAHGISSPEDEEAVTGASFDAALSYLERQYNDGHRYRLHYVTAREAYNLAMAASDHATGDPERFYDAIVPPYLASPAGSGTTALDGMP